MGWLRGQRRGPMSDETRRKLSEGKRGRPFSPVTLELYRRSREGKSTASRMRAVYDRLFEEQGGRCAICGSADPKYGRDHSTKLVRDHDYSRAEAHGHRRGRFCEDEIRGLLCASCNRYVGWLERVGDDTPGKRALDYLASRG